MRGDFIVKVQHSLQSSDGAHRWLFYNQDRTVTLGCEGPAEPELECAMHDTDRAFYLANVLTVDGESKLNILLDSGRQPEQGW